MTLVSYRKSGAREKEHCDDSNLVRVSRQWGDTSLVEMETYGLHCDAILLHVLCESMRSLCDISSQICILLHSGKYGLHSLAIRD